MEEKSLYVQNIEVSYKIVGEGPAILILHGWGRGSDSWVEVQEKLAKAGYRVVVPDLPGFGQSELPQTVWGVNDYVAFAGKFAEKLNLGTFVLMGHSFVGQVALKFAHMYPEKIEKLVLVAPAAIRREPGQREIFIQRIAKTGGLALSFLPGEVLRNFARKVFARIIGRSDYLEAQGIKREIMQKVLREDLSHLFSQISTKTLLIWGENDRPVPLEDGYFMEKHIPHARLRVILQVGHRVNKEAPEKLQEIILEFLEN